MVILLVGLGAGILEVVLFAIAVNTKDCGYCEPNWDLAIAASRSGILTSLICIVSGVVGARQKRGLGISELGVVVGIAGLFFTLGVEAFQHSSGGFLF